MIHLQARSAKDRALWCAAITSHVERLLKAGVEPPTSRGSASGAREASDGGESNAAAAAVQRRRARDRALHATHAAVIRRLSPLCADCDAADPEWISLSCGVLVRNYASRRYACWCASVSVLALALLMRAPPPPPLPFLPPSLRLRQVCIACSGVHRELGVDVSKIRSLDLDEIDLDALECIMALGGNARCVCVIYRYITSCESFSPFDSLPLIYN